MPPQAAALDHPDDFWRGPVEEAVKTFLLYWGAFCMVGVPALLWKLRGTFAERREVVTLELLRERLEDHDASIRTALQTAVGGNHVAFIREVESINRGIEKIEGSIKEATTVATAATTVAMQALNEAQSAHRQIEALDRHLSARLDTIERLCQQRGA